jgi:23S rRNA pseudouridine1911/1915/1917 synthase
MPQNPTPRLLLDDGPLFAVWKPAGLATQAPEPFPSLEAQMKEWLRRREAKAPDGNVYLGVPHRLDRPVSGVILFTRHVRAASRISLQFEKRQVRKTYWACVENHVEPASGTWTDHLKKTYGKPHAEVVAPDDPYGRVAVLHYRTLGTFELPASSTVENSSGPKRGTWLEIELETGRTHQIRIQAASRGHAVVGDAFYGATSTFGAPPADERDRHIALHARSIELRHPMTNEPISITAPLPDDWRELGLPLPESEYLTKS